MSSMGTAFAFFHSFQVSSMRDLGQDWKRCRRSSCPVSISMSENVSINSSSYTNSELLYPRFVISLKKCVFGLHGVMWSTSTFYKNGQTQAITNSYRILILKRHPHRCPFWHCWNVSLWPFWARVIRQKSANRWNPLAWLSCAVTCAI